MVWTPDTRKQYARDRQGYASDMTDAEWGKSSRSCRRLLKQAVRAQHV